MGTNDFLPFGVGAGANVISQADWAALAQRGTGFLSGVAQSAQLNKAWRQSSIMSAVLAQFICDRSGQDALDDGTLTTLLANLKASAAAVNGDSTKSFSVAAATQAQHAVPLSQVASAVAMPTVGISANTSLLASASGAFYEISAGVATLPAAADKLTFEFWGTGAATGSIAAPAGVTLQYPDGTITVGGTYSIGLNTAIRVRCDGASWLITNISGVVRAKSGAFTGDVAMSGSLVVTGPAAVGAPTLPGHAAQAGLLGNRQQVMGTTVATTLTPAQAGSLVNVGGSATYTISMPVSTAVRNGGAFLFFSTTGMPVTIACQGSDVIASASGTTLTSFVLNPNDTLLLETNATGIWFASGGSAQLKYSTAIGGTAAGSGYQRFPSGLILQYGAGTTDGGGNLTVTFPLRYPNAALGGSASLYGGGGSTLVTVTGQTVAQISLTSIASSTGAAQPSQPISWLSWGR